MRWKSVTAGSGTLKKAVSYSPRACGVRKVIFQQLQLKMKTVKEQILYRYSSKRLHRSTKIYEDTRSKKLCAKILQIQKLNFEICNRVQVITRTFFKTFHCHIILNILYKIMYAIFLSCLFSETLSRFRNQVTLYPVSILRSVIWAGHSQRYFPQLTVN